MEEPKKFRLSATDKKLGGVCGGLAEYLNVDSTILRLLFVVFTLCGGCGLLIYVIAWLIAPKA